ncbi:MAG: hypothetical protein HZA15_05940 [Nitrospirae bacterium]|nr:hypothetical protein [Nitrospirota bacterium]
MKITKNERGIALVMVLMLALIGLAMVSALLFMVTQGTSLSGAMKFYGTADEAAVGATDFTGEYIYNRGLMTALGATTVCNCGDPAIYTDTVPDTCRCRKICNPTSQYNASGTACVDEDTATGGLQISYDPSQNFDGSAVLGEYTVTYKIIDTIEGNTDPGSIVASRDLVSHGVVAASGGVYSPPHFPFIYRFEVMAQKTINPREHAIMSVLYGY